MALFVVGVTSAPHHPLSIARAYEELPDHPGTVQAMGQLFVVVDVGAPLLLGAVADRFGLGAAMGCLLLQPVVVARSRALLAGRPRAGLRVVALTPEWLAWLPPGSPGARTDDAVCRRPARSRVSSEPAPSPSANAASSRASSRALGRSSGSLSRQRATRSARALGRFAVEGPHVRRVAGPREAGARRVISSKGRCPVSIKKRMMPTA